MKKVLCVLLVALTLMGIAFAEDFRLWHDYKFGMTANEVLMNSGGLVIMKDTYGNIEDNIIDSRLQWQDNFGLYELQWIPKEKNSRTVDGICYLISEVAKIPYVSVFFSFDNKESMNGILFRFGASVDMHDEQYEEKFEATYSDLATRLEAKYGTPITSDTMNVPQIDGIVTKSINSFRTNTDAFNARTGLKGTVSMEGCLSWFVDIGDGNYVKIECAKMNYDGLLDVFWGYSFVSNIEFKNAPIPYDDL